TPRTRPARGGRRRPSRRGRSRPTGAPASSPPRAASTDTCPAPPPPAAPRRHLLSISDLTAEDVWRVLDTAESLAASLDREMKKLPTLRGRTVVNLFYESSTRTLSSFELAAKRLSADTMSVRSSGSSVDKGESLKD